MKQPSIPGIFFLAVFSLVAVNYSFAQNEQTFDPNHLVDAKMLVDYFEQMSIPKPLVIRQGQQLQEHQQKLRSKTVRVHWLISTAVTYAAGYS